MLKHLTQFYRPATIEEACALLAAKDRRNAVLAGGTHIAAVNDSTIEGLVDLGGLNLSYIRRTEEGYAIGAMTPVQDVFKSSMLVGPSGQLLRAAAGRIGSTLLRHSITAGGNLMALFPWSDLPPALLALDAQALCRRGVPKRTVAVKNLIETGPRHYMEPGEILVELQVPEYGRGTGVAFHKFSKTTNDYAMITVAVRITMQGETVKEARIALNAVCKKAQRRPDAEKQLENMVPTAERIAAAAAAAARDLDMTTDFRASREYREEVLPVFVRRCIDEALHQARA
ncbi:MAG TPA: FAD binding domain-containing protein [Candidatus Ozemobacteraceae bacterium]|nr:FAD binding domain-containing protein [Candidatus Ozemobacteraceae bacterium]HQG27295.1 FAD binding domain-containing protein [Candidatus Ozemobacteraceae bacterium]